MINNFRKDKLYNNSYIRNERIFDRIIIKCDIIIKRYYKNYNFLSLKVLLLID